MVVEEATDRWEQQAAIRGGVSCEAGYLLGRFARRVEESLVVC